METGNSVRATFTQLLRRIIGRLVSKTLAADLRG